MLKRNSALIATLSFVALAGCEQQDAPVERLQKAVSPITDVAHTPVERQSIGNCWLYAEASWVESMNLAAISAGNPGGGGEGDTCAHNVCDEGVKLEASCSSCATAICAADEYCCDTEWDSVCTGAVAEICGADACNAVDDTPEVEVEPLDVSQSYWTYWHWFDQITGRMWGNEISTGGNTWTSHAIIRDRGVMKELDFVPEDSDGEMSNRQSSALNKINAALKDGELSSSEARRDGKIVRKVMDEAWGLSDEVRQQMDAVFGEDGETTLRGGASVEGTKIIDPTTVPVRYTKLVNGTPEFVDTHLVDAIRQWHTVRYPWSNNDKRQFQIRVQRALHDQQPVVITWDVDFNAMENGQNDRRGAFNLETLANAGKPGRQGGHMTVLEDYAADTAEFGFLEAGKTLDKNNPEDAAKLAALLKPDTQIHLFRTKNSWGAARPDRAFAKDFPGYHDLWMDYLNGPIKWCPDESSPTNDNCRGETTPLDSVMLPPGY